MGCIHARIQKVLSGRGSYCDVFLVDERREDPNTTISGPLSARQRNAIKMALRWCAGDGPALTAGRKFVAL